MHIDHQRKQRLLWSTVFNVGDDKQVYEDKGSYHPGNEIRKILPDVLSRAGNYLLN
jgi:hypothetical protein